MREKRKRRAEARLLRRTAGVAEALPGAAGRAAALAGRAASAHGRAAVGLRDRERVPRLRGRRDRVVVRLGRVDADDRLRQVEARVVALDVVAGLATRSVRAVVGVTRLE